jgi:N-acetyl-anhydromuramyl-L-alanine amidase AmpD
MPIRSALAFSLLLFASAHAASATLADVEQSIVPVAAWGGTPADPAQAHRQRINHITLHHQGEPFKPGTDPQQYLRNLQKWSRGTKHWLDIPYHYIIDLDGKIYEGRKIGYAGDTNTEYDPTGHALIEVVGNFEEVEPNQQQLDAVVRLMAMLAHKYGVTLDHIASHRDFSAQTVCPGANLYRYVQDGYFRRKVALRLAQEQEQQRAAAGR